MTSPAALVPAGVRGQATVVVLLALGVAAALGLVGLSFVGVAVERARAQSTADGAALAAARALARPPFGLAAARAAAAVYVRASGAGLVDVAVAGAAVEVRVRRPRRRLAVPVLLGGGGAPVGAEAVARAALAPGWAAVGDGGIVGAGGGADGLPADVPPAVRGLILAAAARERLPPGVLAAQLRAESGFSPTAVSRVGAQGIAQFMPATWAGSWNPWRGASPFDPAAAIPAQARYLRRLLDAVGGDLAHALAAYNAGLAGSAGGPEAWPAETRAYVGTILRAAGVAGDGAANGGADVAGRVPVVGGALAAGGIVAAAALGGLDELRPRLVG